MTGPQYTGTLRKGAQPDTIEGELVDAWGWRLHITGRKSPTGYTLEAKLGDVPAALRIHGLDVATGAAAVTPKALGTGKYWTEGATQESDVKS